jgi:hypothetical protein
LGLWEAMPPFRPASEASAWSIENDLFAGFTDIPPFRPACAANSGFCEKLRFSAGTLLPPNAAIARLFSGSSNAKPRLLFTRSTIAKLRSKSERSLRCNQALQLFGESPKQFHLDI